MIQRGIRMKKEIYVFDTFLLVVFCTYKYDVETIYNSFAGFTIDEIKLYIKAMLDKSEDERNYDDWDRVDVYTGTKEEVETILKLKYEKRNFSRMLTNRFTVKGALSLIATVLMCLNGCDAMIAYRDLKSYFNNFEIGKYI